MKSELKLRISHCIKAALCYRSQWFLGNSLLSSITQITSAPKKKKNSLYFKEIHAQCFILLILHLQKISSFNTAFVLFPFPRKVRFKSRKHHKGKNTNYTDKTRGSIPIHSTGVSWPFLLFRTLSLGSPTISSRMNWSVPLKLQVLLTQHHMAQGKIKKT